MPSPAAVIKKCLLPFQSISDALDEVHGLPLLFRFSGGKVANFPFDLLQSFFIFIGQIGLGKYFLTLFQETIQLRGTRTFQSVEITGENLIHPQIADRLHVVVNLDVVVAVLHLHSLQ